ncbi:MAG: hypothetical protein H0W59_00335 [Chloroflexia bacterium]|nr:hypothetical protein [Chloroflexia bacterium]
MAQGLSALRPRIPADRDQIPAAMLTPSQAAAFCALPRHDQQHLCAVYRTLQRRGVTDHDLLAAGLLHDLGQQSPRSRVRLVDRIARVALAAVAPRLLSRLTRAPVPRWRAGLALASHHPRLGAEAAAVLGLSPRTCWLIAHHEDRAAPDPDLASLMAADAEHARGRGMPRCYGNPAWRCRDRCVPATMA